MILADSCKLRLGQKMHSALHAEVVSTLNLNVPFGILLFAHLANFRFSCLYRALFWIILLPKTCLQPFAIKGVSVNFVIILLINHIEESQSGLWIQLYRLPEQRVKLLNSWLKEGAWRSPHKWIS
jgi:hypothetical protein